MPSFMSIYTLITGSKFIWSVIRNWRVLSTSFKLISETLKKMHDENRKLPEIMESQQMLLAASNILKTGIIDIPGVDEYQISIDLDKFSSSLLLSVEDTKTGKYHDLMLTKKDK